MTEKLIVQGGSSLQGEVAISGAKNSVLKLMAAALLTGEDIELTNVPRLTDVDVMSEVVSILGCRIQQSGSTLWMNAKDVNSYYAPYDLVSKMRASFNVLGALIGRFGEAKVSLPGGCSIGKRGVDLHIRGLEELGATVRIENGYVEATAKKLVGTEIALDTPSVGATENLMLAAVLAEGTTVISNVAQEPEIKDLANFLNAIGADIHGAGTNEIVIHGVQQKHLHGTSFHVVPDRIEAATYMIAGASTLGQLTLLNILPAHLQSITAKLTEMGVKITFPTPNTLQVDAQERLKATHLVTQPYPGFPTDLQAPFMAMLTIADGASLIKETIYENRFKHIGELKRMGASIEQDGNVAVVTGVDALSGTQVKASDLRAGAALVIASLHAQGTTEILDLHHLDRGYEMLVPKLRSIGASIQRVAADELPVSVGDES